MNVVLYILSTDEIKLRTLEETGRCLVPPGGSDDGSSKNNIAIFVNLDTFRPVLGPTRVYKSSSRCRKCRRRKLHSQGIYNTHSATPIRLWKGRFGSPSTTNDTLPAMLLNVHISPIISTHHSDTRAKLKDTTPKSLDKP